MTRSAWTFGLAAGVLLAATAAWAEQVEIVTYYPSPSATTDDVRAKRMTVGSGYKALNLDDPLAPIADGTLLVEQSVGVGAPVPFKTAPDPSGKSPKNNLLGNLDVNDIWLRSTQSWASQAFADSVAPTKPFRFYFSPPTFRVVDNTGRAWQTSALVSVDIYRDLQLWRSGVQRSDMRMTGWGGCQGAAAVGCPQSLETWNGLGQHWFVSYGTPYFGQGVVRAGGERWEPFDSTNHSECPQIYEIVVDW